jgi:diguanylate cyclase (GGDEF)-like protein
VVFLDVDRLKVVNDTHGHAAGDRVLRELATTLRANLRAYDLIIRVGGDEFVCALSGLTAAEATGRMTLIHLRLAAGLEHCSVTVGVTEL